MRSISLLLFFLALIAGGCGPVETAGVTSSTASSSIAGTWRLSNLKNKPAPGRGEDKLLQAAQDKEILQEGMIISLFKDGTFTEIRGLGAYRTGKWRRDEEAHKLLLTDSTKIEMRFVKRLKRGEQTLLSTKDSAGLEMDFVLSALPLDDQKDDPFYAANNLWRIKPKQRETAEEIEARLANYFKHLALLLKASKERKAETVSFQFSPGIAKIYNGGIGIHPKSVLSGTWKEGFYNEEDAHAAYKMFQEYLSRASYKGASTGAWVDDDYNILISIYGDIQQGQFRK